MSTPIAATILAQLGANRFLAMTGARELLAYPDGLRMRVTGSYEGKRVTHVVITLQSDDTYRVESFCFPTHSLRFLSRYAREGVHAAELRAAFTAGTGLETSL